MTSVTFPPSIGGDGSTFSDDNNPSTGMGNGGYLTRFFLLVAQVIAVALGVKTNADTASAAAAASLGGASTQATSSASASVPASTGGAFSFVVSTGKAFVQGMRVGIVRTSAPTTNYLYGTVTSYNSTSGLLQILVEETSGAAGPFTDWTITASAFGVPKGRTVTGGGLATGGGALDQNRVITVSAAIAADLRFGNDNTKAVTSAAIIAAAAEVALTLNGTTIVSSGSTLNHQEFDNASLTMAGNYTLPNLANPKVGSGGTIRLTQDGTGGRTLSLGSNWKRTGGATALSTAAGAVDLIHYKVITSTLINYRIEKAPS